MNYPKPYEINTDQPFWNLCDGLTGSSKKEATVRIFCRAAQKHSRWNLTQQELDEQDASGVFTFNGLRDEGWFERHLADGWFVPTAKMIEALTDNGLIYEDEDEDEDEWVEDEDHVTFVDEEEKPRLKLFSVRVVYSNKDKRKSYFTVLDTDKDAAEQTVIERVKKFRQLLGQRGGISTIQVWEVKGPFEAGQIIAEER